MTLIPRLLSRVFGPALVAYLLGVLLSPMLMQRSTRIDALPLAVVDERVGVTLGLLAPALLFATVLWLPMAVLVAFRRGPAGLLTALGTVGAQALAPFVVGLVLSYALGVKAGLFPVVGAGTAAHFVLPSLTLAVTLVGVLAHVTYLRAAADRAAGHADDDPDRTTALLAIADDWLDTLSRYAGAFVSASIVVEVVFGLPGVGRVLVNAVFVQDQPVTSAALYRLVTISTVLTAMFGIGAAGTTWLLDRRRASVADTTLREAGPVTVAAVEGQPFDGSRWLAVSALALGGLMLFGLLAFSVTQNADPFQQSLNARLAVPGQGGHPFGTDSLGRDVAARIAFSLRSGLLVVVPTTLSAAVVGLALGLVAAAFRLGDLLVSALTDSVQVVPALAFGLLVSGAMGPGATMLGVVIPVVMTFVLARLTRDAVRAAWAGGPHHVRPATGGVLLALCVGLATAILLEATLGFFGVSFLPPTPTLGGMMSDGMRFLELAPWLFVYAGLALTTLVASLLLLGYGAFGLLRPRATTASLSLPEPPTLALA